MRLHIILNEKIAPRTIQIFESVFPNDNKFIVLTGFSKKGDMDLNRFPPCNIKFVNIKDKYEFLKVVGDPSQYKHIIIHFLIYEVAKLIENIKHPSIYWIEWGADLYRNLLEPKGFPIYENFDAFLKMNKPQYPLILSKVLYKIKRKLYQRTVCKVVRNIKYFVPDSMPGEYELLLSYYPQFSHLVYKNFFYYPVDSIIKDKSLLSVGHNIMVNHCASFTGNHIGVIDKLAQLNLSNRKVVFPISYGNKDYASKIEEYAIKKLGDSASFIKNYLTLEEYNNRLADCNVFIYGHYRQEAVGNILIALYLGGKVFLYNQNPLLGFYKSIGLIIFSIDDDLTKDMINFTLTVEQIENNKRILENYYSESVLMMHVKKGFE